MNFELPRVMGILNVTPDSFYDGGRYAETETALRRALDMVSEGAHIIDIGGESTRPGSESVSEQEELDRVCPVIEGLRARMDIPVSVDTTKSVVAEAALKAGASIINDISGCTFDQAMPEVAARYGAEIVLMHIRGIPRTMQMQQNTGYDDLMGEIISFLDNSARLVMGKGLPKEKIILDPGIGFAKTIEDNYRIINSIDRLKKTGYRILIGLSRKSLVAKLYDEEENRLPATIALNTVALYNGADIIRVHDVKAHSLAMAAVLKLREVL